jgi:hypothetical protein
MENRASPDIDEVIREEKRLTALESQFEAWADGLSAGIEPEILAEAALSAACQELLRVTNEDAALALIDRIRERIVGGEFSPVRSRH